MFLSDADEANWRDIQRREVGKLPDNIRPFAVYGMADRNIECWLAVNRVALAKELNCTPEEIPRDDPSGFVKKKFGLGERDNAREDAKNRVAQFVAQAPVKSWIEGSESFRSFYGEARSLAARTACEMPNELESS